MKYRFLTLAILLFTINGFGQTHYKNAFADTLMHKYITISNPNYKINYTVKDDDGKVKHYNIPLIFNADESFLTEDESGIYYGLRYLKTNKKAKYAATMLQQAFEEIAADGKYKLTKDDAHSYKITISRTDYLYFSTNADKDDPRYLSLRVIYLKPANN